MKKIIVVLLSLLVAFGLASCDNSSTSSSNAPESSSSVAESSSSTKEVVTYGVGLNTGIYVSFNQVSNLDLSELVTGDVVKFSLSFAPDTEGTVVCKINNEVITPDSSSVYSYTVKDASLVIETTGIKSIHNVLNFMDTEEVTFVSSTEDDLPSTLLAGETVSFKLALEDNTTGTPVVKAGETVLEADDSSVYTYTMEDTDTSFTVSGVRMLSEYAINLDLPLGYTLTAKDGSEFSTTCLEGSTVEFMVSVAEGSEPIDSVKIGDVVLVASEEGVYTYTPKADFTIVLAV